MWALSISCSPRVHESRTFFLPSVGDQLGDQMDECVYGTSGSGVFNLADVFELVIDGFNQGPLPDKDLGLAQLRLLHK